MKARYGLVILLVAVLALTGVGCKKVTGGGWFISSFASEHSGNKITFGFNAHPIGDQMDEYEIPVPPAPPEDFVEAKGQFQMVDHTDNTHYHGTFNGTYAYIEPERDTAHFSGTLLMDGDPTDFCVVFTDPGESGAGAGDWIEIFIGTKDYPGIDVPPTYGGSLQGGNIKVHKK